jgi:hypothetical protein
MNKQFALVCLAILVHHHHADPSASQVQSVDRMRLALIRNVETHAQALAALEPNAASSITTRFVAAHQDTQEIHSQDVILNVSVRSENKIK